MARWMALTSRSYEPLARSSHSLTAIGRSLYCFGGEHAPRVPIDATVHRYDLDAGEWEALPAPAGAPCPSARVAHAAAAVGDTLYVFGGREGVNEQKALGDTWAFDTVARAWRQLACSGVCPPARSYHAATALAGTTKLFVFGGCGASGRLNDLWALDTATETWEHLPSSDAVAPRGGSCVTSHAGCLYVAAGYSGAAELSDLHCYDVAARAWRVLEASGAATLPARSVAALGVVGDALYIFGGEAEVSEQGHAGAGRFRNDAWRWPLGGEEPKAWTQVHAAGEPPAPRGWLAAAAVPGLGLCLHGGNCENNERLSDMLVLQA